MFSPMTGLALVVMSIAPSTILVELREWLCLMAGVAGFGFHRLVMSCNLGVYVCGQRSQKENRYDQSFRSMYDAPLNEEARSCRRLMTWVMARVCQGDQPWTTWATVPGRGAEGQTEGTHVAFPAIHGQQERTRKCDPSNLCRQLLSQTHVTPCAHQTAQPETGQDHHRYRHPQHPALGLDANFIALDLPRVQPLATHPPVLPEDQGTPT